jgi:hypothetical protein
MALNGCLSLLRTADDYKGIFIVARLHIRICEYTIVNQGIFYIRNSVNKRKQTADLQMQPPYRAFFLSYVNFVHRTHNRTKTRFRYVQKDKNSVDLCIVSSSADL